MKRVHKTALLLLIFGMLTLVACQRNFYSGTGKGSKCGCPSHKGMVGY